MPIRVSSKIMSLTSPVFAAMLSPRYAEGQYAGQDDWKVSLPEDDPEAMYLICNIIHFRPQDDPAQCSPRMLGKVAKICEKYDLIGSLGIWADLVFPSKDLTSLSKVDCSQLLMLSYMFASQAGVWLTSRKLIEGDFCVRECQTPSTETTSQEDEMELGVSMQSNDLLGKILIINFVDLCS